MVFVLNSLHVRQARQTFSKVVSPPRDAGVTWSYVSGMPAHRFAREAVTARPSIRGIDLRAQRLRNPGRHDLGIQLSDGHVVTAPAQENGGVRLDEHEPIGLAPEHFQLGAFRIIERSGCALLEQFVVSHHFGLGPAAPR